MANELLMQDTADSVVFCAVINGYEATESAPVSEKNRDDARKCIEQTGKGPRGPAFWCVSDRPDKT